MALILCTGSQEQTSTSEPSAATRFFPLSEVRAGLRGNGYTVFEGVIPEAFEVEILGVLRNSLGPGRDMILARLHGPKPEYTGVVAGMSGSPVYIDGRLVGALSYRIGQFSKEPIAGITPIQQMLEVRDEPSPAPRVATGEGSPEMRAIESPLTFNGFSQEAVDRFGDRFRAMGLVPVAGLGGMDASQAQPEALIPGSAVSAVLVDGDLSITGTCTVSYVDASRLLACGHPITQSGAVDMPMAKAQVVATLASPLNSFKIVNATEIAGAFTEDRASAILGRFGAHAEMIPVTIAIAPEGAPDQVRTVHLRVLNNRQLTPQVMMVSLFQALQQSESGTAETSYRLHGEIALRDTGSHKDSPAHELPSVQVNGWMAPNEFNSGAINAALFLGDTFERVYLNPQERPAVTAVRLEVATSPRRRELTLEGARLSRIDARPGDMLSIDATARPYREPAQTVHLEFRLPASLQPGSMRVLVSDAATVDRLRSLAGTHPTGLLDAVERANALHANNRIYVTLLDHEAQVVLDSTSLSELPLSMANILEPLKDAQRARLSGESILELGSAPVNGALSGSQVLPLTIQ